MTRITPNSTTSAWWRERRFRSRGCGGCWWAAEVVEDSGCCGVGGAEPGGGAAASSLLPEGRRLCFARLSHLMPSQECINHAEMVFVQPLLCVVAQCVIYL